MEGRGTDIKGGLRLPDLRHGPLHPVLSPLFLPVPCRAWTLHFVLSCLCPGMSSSPFAFQSQFVLLTKKNPS